MSESQVDNPNARTQPLPPLWTNDGTKRFISQDPADLPTLDMPVIRGYEPAPKEPHHYLQWARRGTAIIGATTALAASLIQFNPLRLIHHGSSNNPTASGELNPGTASGRLTEPHLSTHHRSYPGPTNGERRVDLIGPVESKNPLETSALQDVDKLLKGLGSTILTHPLRPDVQSWELDEIVQGKTERGGAVDFYLSDNPDPAKPDITFLAEREKGSGLSVGGAITFFLDRGGQLSTAAAAAEAPPIAPSTIRDKLFNNKVSWLTTAYDGTMNGTVEAQAPNGHQIKIGIKVTPEGAVTISSGGNLKNLLLDLGFRPQNGS